VFSLHSSTSKTHAKSFCHGFSLASVHLNSDATLIALSVDSGCAIKTHLLHLQPPAGVIAAFILPFTKPSLIALLCSTGMILCAWFAVSQLYPMPQNYSWLFGGMIYSKS
jgi:hypothetical protein